MRPIIVRVVSLLIVALLTGEPALAKFPASPEPHIASPAGALYAEQALSNRVSLIRPFLLAPIVMAALVISANIRSHSRPPADQVRMPSGPALLVNRTGRKTPLWLELLAGVGVIGTAVKAEIHPGIKATLASVFAEFSKLCRLPEDRIVWVLQTVFRRGLKMVVPFAMEKSKIERYQRELLKADFRRMILERERVGQRLMTIWEIGLGEQPQESSDLINLFDEVLAEEFANGVIADPTHWTFRLLCVDANDEVVARARAELNQIRTLGQIGDGRLHGEKLDLRVYACNALDLQSLERLQLEAERDIEGRAFADYIFHRHVTYGNIRSIKPKSELHKDFAEMTAFDWVWFLDIFLQMKNIVGTFGRKGTRYVVDSVAHLPSLGRPRELPGLLRFPGTRLLTAAELMGPGADLFEGEPIPLSGLEAWGPGIFEIVDLERVRKMTLAGFHAAVHAPIDSSQTGAAPGGLPEAVILRLLEMLGIAPAVASEILQETDVLSAPIYAWPEEIQETYVRLSEIRRKIIDAESLLQNFLFQIKHAYGLSFQSDFGIRLVYLAQAERDIQGVLRDIEREYGVGALTYRLQLRTEEALRSAHKRLMIRDYPELAAQLEQLILNPRVRPAFEKGAPAARKSEDSAA